MFSPSRPSFFKRLTIFHFIAIIAVSVSLLILFPGVATLIVCTPLAGLGIAGIVLQLVTKTPKQPQLKAVDNPWTGKQEIVEKTPEESKSNGSGFASFTVKSLDSSVKTVSKFKMPHISTRNIFRRFMRFMAAILVFVYSVVLIFSAGSAISLMFVATDFVLLYLIWISRG